MAKRFTPIRLDDKLRKSLDQFVLAWNRSGAPKSNRTLVIATAIEQYLKRWRPMLKKVRSTENAAKAPDRVLAFPRSSTKRSTRDYGFLRQAL
jgi:predicted transcriptional regulator